MAIYLQIASVTVNDIDIVCRICVKCIWNSIYAAQPYLKSLRPVDGYNIFNNTTTTKNVILQKFISL